MTKMPLYTFGIYASSNSTKKKEGFQFGYWEKLWNVKQRNCGLFKMHALSHFKQRFASLEKAG